MVKNTNKFNIKSSDTKFGRTFCLIFLLLSSYLYFNEMSQLSIGFFAIAIIFIVLAEKTPSKLSKLNILWFKLGLFLSSITNPIILGAIYFFIITPIGVIQQIFGRDQLRLKNKKNESYWLNSEKIKADSFKNQF